MMAGFALLLAACGGDVTGQTPAGNGGAQPVLPPLPSVPAPGTVQQPWTDYCTVTFTRDASLFDSFGRAQVTVHPGDVFLLGESGVQYLTEHGTVELQVHADASTGAMPFETRCDVATAPAEYVVFENTTVYTDEALTTKLCDLTAGTSTYLPNRGFSYVWVGSGGGGAVYQISLGPFSPRCGQADLGYVVASSMELFGATTFVLPVGMLFEPPQ